MNNSKIPTFISQVPVIDPNRHGRKVSYVDMNDIQSVLNEINYVYTNTSQPGALAGDHYHKKHFGVLMMLYGQLDFVLEDITTKIRWSGTIKQGDPLLVIPTYVYHAGKNSGTTEAVAMIWTNTIPRQENDTFEYKIS